MKRPMICIVLAFGAFTIAARAPAQTVPDGVSPLKAQNSQCPRVAFSAIEKPQAMRRSFSVSRSSDLIIHVLFDTKLAEDHVVTLKVFTPNGHLYRRFDVPFTSNKEKRSAASKRLPGYPYPLKIQTTSTVKAGKRRYESVDVMFPVAGSAIVTSSLYGRWNIEVFLDGAAEPCRRPTFFYLRE